MKKLIALFIAGVSILLPMGLQSQFMADYYPTGLPVISNTVNLVTVTETYADASGESRSVSSILENPFGVTSDVWVHSVDRAGNPTLSLRYGLPDVEETAAAIIRCPNGDFIIAANTEADGIPSVWLFRIDINGNVLWTFRYYNQNTKLRAYCIKKTNEALSENYVIAGTADSDRTLIAFKINRNGGVIWHNTYTDPNSPIDIINIPKSMLVSGRNVVIVGNRQNPLSPNRDIFLIGVHQVTGVESVLYRYIDNGGRDDSDPFINFARAGEFVLTYKSVVNVFNEFTGRIAFNRLTAGFLLSLPQTSVYWEGGTKDSYGHSIYLSNGTTATQYDIGGGTTAGNIHNPLFFSVDNNGLIIPGTYRRLWLEERDFISTYMMQDAFNVFNQYEHHNYYRDNSVDPNRGSMSLLRDQTLPSPCNKFPDLTRIEITPTLIINDYKENPILEPKEYPADVEKVHGEFKTCDGNSGIFRTAKNKNTVSETIAATQNFKIYPSLVTRGASVTINLEAVQDGFATITVYNLQSQQVMRTTERVIKGTNRLTVHEMGNLPAGTFIVEVKSGGETHKTKIVRL